MLRRWATALVLLLAVALIPGAGPLEAAGRPSVVVILLDDAATPTLEHMDRAQALIADRGATLTEFIFSQPLCCPSRATMLRGQYSHNTGVTSNGGSNGGYLGFYRNGNESSTLASWFQDAGYTTGYLGKYLNRYPTGAGLPDTHVPAGWDHWFGTFDDAVQSFDYTVNDNGTVRRFGNAPTDYVTDVLATRAKNFIRDSRAPFLLMIAPNAPHIPSTPAPRHKGMFSDVRYPRTPSFNEVDVSDKPSFISSQPLLSASEITKMDAQYGKRLASLQAVDEMVQGVVDTLNARGLLDNTYLLLVSDNGHFQGEHRLHKGKDQPYEEAVRVPLYIRGPGIAAGSVISHQIGNVDIPVTLSDAAGITPPNFVDGRSFLPLLHGSSIPWRSAYLLSRAGIDAFVGLRTPRYTYVEYSNGEREFYDRDEDPYQLENTYSTMDPQLKAALHDRLLALKDCRGDECRRAEEQPLPKP